MQLDSPSSPLLTALHALHLHARDAGLAECRAAATLEQRAR
jgi:hypothetical protein